MAIVPSKVPSFNFSDNLIDQEEELQKNPLLTRFSESRYSFKDDPHRPRYHYVNPEGNLNDPNGLCFWKGNWHLFYQAYPPEDPRQHWGHAVSSDLIHWRDLPYAIYPYPENCCFSGATLVEEDRVIAMYHGTEVGNMIATSSDPLLLNWEKLNNSAVIPLNNSSRYSDSKNSLYSVFDPCIWKNKNFYYALSGGVTPTGPRSQYVAADFLFRSTDLSNWEFLHIFVEDDIFTQIGDDGACPYFWPIGDRHILLFFSHMSGGQYIIGSYNEDKQKFYAEKHGRFNFGAAHPSGVHAPSATTCKDGSVIAIFNMNKGKDCFGWDQIMTLPRQLTLSKSGDLQIKPAGDVLSLRDEHTHFGSHRLQHNEEINFSNVSTNCCEALFKILINDAKRISIDVLCSPDRQEFTRITFYVNGGFNNRFRSVVASATDANQMRPTSNDSVVTIDSSNSSILRDVSIRPPESASIRLHSDEILDVRVFIDRSVVEVFVDDQQCLAVRVYPSLVDSTGMSVTGLGGTAELVSLDIWEMRSIY